MANNLIQIKRTTVSGRTPNTTSSGNSSYINPGELAVNLTDGKFFSANATSGLLEIGSNVTTIFISSNAVIGNSTSNIAANSTSIVVSNTTVNTRITIPSAAQYTGNFFLHANGQWATPTAAAAPAGGNTQIQYNASGSAGASADLTFNTDTATLYVANAISFSDGTYQTSAATIGKILATARGCNLI